MTYAPMYPIKTWDCNICDKTNPGDLGFCPRCQSGSIIPRGGLLSGEDPYKPLWHAKEAGFEGMVA